MNKIAFYTGYMEKTADPEEMEKLRNVLLFTGGAGAGLGALLPYKGHTRLESTGRGALAGTGLGLGMYGGDVIGKALAPKNKGVRILADVAGAIAGNYGGHQLANYLELGKQKHIENR